MEQKSEPWPPRSCVIPLPKHEGLHASGIKKKKTLFFILANENLCSFSLPV